MKRTMMMISVALTIPCLPLAAGEAPKEVLESAKTAVEDLGKEIIRGNHKAAFDQMYPRWKRRIANKHGDLSSLEENMAKIGEKMAKHGISILSFEATGDAVAHEVWPIENDASGKVAYTKWMVLVSTVTRMRFMEEGNPEPRFIDTHGFQVAIADKGSDDWKFINGTDISVSDLRSLFTSLPANLKLPAIRREEVEASK